jgi:hypothetical protein
MMTVALKRVEEKVSQIFPPSSERFSQEWCFQLIHPQASDNGSAGFDQRRSGKKFLKILLKSFTRRCSIIIIC